MSALFSPWGNQQIFDANGDPAAGWKIYAYAAGSSTPLTTYTDATGSVAQSFPIILDTLGLPISGLIWLAPGSTYKFVLTNASDVVQKTADGISGVSDSAPTITQWQSSNFDPTYISANSFAVTGDQTNELHVGRRLQFTTSVGTVYGLIDTSAYTTLTTVTMAMDGSGVLDAGLSVVNLSLLRADHPAQPRLNVDLALAAGRSVNFEGATDDANETTLSAADPSADRALLLPDASGTLAIAADATGRSIPVGAVCTFFDVAAPDGWLEMKGATIGSALSGATARANADATDLYTKIWNGSDNTDYPIQTSGGVATTRGASAAADFAANKRLPLPDARGEGLRGWDHGRGVDAGRRLGSSQGASAGSFTYSISGDDGDDTTGAFASIRNITFNGATLGDAPLTGTSGTATVTITPGDTRMRNLAFLACIKY